MAPIRQFSAAEKGKALQEGPDPLPPKKRLALHSRDEGDRQVVSRPWYKRPPPGFPLEVSPSGNGALTRGWQTFARARGLSQRCTLHFKFDGDATLYVRVFGEDGRRAGCYPEDDDRGRGPSPGDDGEDSARVIGGAQGSPSFTGS